MIANRENRAERILLDGKDLDLHHVISADDFENVVTMFELRPDGSPKFLSDMTPAVIELRGDVRIFMPKRERIH
jgi:hypothetical protein